MPSSPTTRNRLEKQGAGENSNTWGAPKLNTVLDLVDASLDGLTTKALTGNYSLTSTNYAADESRNRVLRFTGTGSFTVTIPSVEKWYIVDNQTTGTLTITTGSGTTAALPTGLLSVVACDGTNCKLATGVFNLVVNSSGFASFNGASVNGAFNTSAASGAAGLSVASAGGTERIDIVGRDSAGNCLIRAVNGRLNLNSGGDGRILFNPGGVYQGDIQSDGTVTLQGVANNTNSGAANVYVDPATGSLYRSTSSARYKDNIRDYRPIGDFMALRPVYYTQKGVEGGRWYGGLIAEEVHAAGFSEFVEYNDEGQPDAIHYAHMVALLTHHLQDAIKRIEKLEAA